MPRLLLHLTLLAACTGDPKASAPDTELLDSPTIDETDESDTPAVDTEPVDTDTDPPGCTFALAAAPPEDPMVFTTSGCWTVTIDHTTITFTGPSGLNRVETWGDPHENLNGKHIKDWLTRRRTILLPGGAIVTMRATGKQGVVDLVNVYDGPHAREIDNATHTVTSQTDDPLETAALEAAEHDGETARITELSDDRVSFDNEYTQEADEDGLPLDKVPTPARLGETGGTANPNNVNDFYDDPRLGHT
jgi:hypothetical protein